MFTSVKEEEFKEKLIELVNKYVSHFNTSNHLLGEKINVNINKNHQKITIYY